MIFYKHFLELVDTNLIHCLIPLVLTLFLVNSIFQNRFETKKSLSLVRWIMVGYTLLTWIVTINGQAHPAPHVVFNERVTGQYRWVYLSMLFCTLILPFSLLIKKLASNFLYVLLVTFCLKIGFYVELFMILITRKTRNYLPEVVKLECADSNFSPLLFVSLQGVIIAILILGLFQLKTKVNSTS